MKTLIAFFVISLFAGHSYSQTKYTLKNTDIAFSSPIAFMPLYNTNDYALYKSNFIEVSIKLVPELKDYELSQAITGKIDQKMYVETAKPLRKETSDQIGVFVWAEKKQKSPLLYLFGLINSKLGKKTCFIEVTYDSKKSTEVEHIISSFFTGNPVQIAEKQGAHENATPKTTVTANEALALKIAEDIRIAEQQRREVEKSEQQRVEREKVEQERIKQEKAALEAQKNQQSTTYSSPHNNTSATMVIAPVINDLNTDPTVKHVNLIVLTPIQKQEFLNAHNRWRTDVGVAPLKWSNEMENLAADWAVSQGVKDCDMEHRPNNHYGENLYWSSGMEFSPSGAVDSWGREINDYKGETVGSSNAVVGHYTQVVWRKTTEVGCAAFQCGSALLVVCNYNPPGNYVGQHPYK